MFNGGSAVLDYAVWHDDAQGTGEFIEFATGVESTSFTATPMTQCSVYTFKIKARNDYGYSDFSNAVSILAAQIPATPIPPST